MAALSITPLVPLETLSVLPKERGGGVGRALLSAVDDELIARGVRLLEIGVVAANEGANRFCEREGATPYLVQWLRPVGKRP